MRIISGLFKGKRINYLKNSNTRPLKDYVKENIFNILKHKKLADVQFENSVILDLYSGIGSFGLECISRGAKKVTFVEKNKIALEVLHENLRKLSILKKSQIFNCEVNEMLNQRLKEKYSVFFLDPPFADNNFIKDLELIKEKKIFDTNHIIIIHREKGSQDSLGKHIHILGLKEYGRSKIIFGLFN